MNEMTNSHILVRRFGYLEPQSLEEALRLLAEYGPRAKVLAGGTDLLVHMKMERSAPEAVIYIKNIPELDGIANRAGHLRIGACTSIRMLEQDVRVQAAYPALIDACASFSTTQVQTMGTIGGNVANGSPASDTAPALIALGATIEMTGLTGPRCLPLDEFFTGPGKTVLQPGELVTAILLPEPVKDTGSAFIKVTRVAADIAKASVAVQLVRDPQEPERVKECRMAYGSVAPTPMRARKAEALLNGQVLTEELALRVSKAASEEIMPISDVRSTAQYRRNVVRAITYDAIIHAWRKSGQPISVPMAEEKVAVKAPKAGMAPIEANEKRLIELKINGEKHEAWVLPNELLLNVIREHLQLTGAKYGCGIGECSACTVLMDGAPTLSCLVLAVSAVGKEIQTVEGLQKPNGDLDPIQEAFIDNAAYQCGYCTPGMLLTSKSLLAENPHPSEDDVRHYLRGNICRCTGYANIVRAVLSCVEN